MGALALADEIAVSAIKPVQKKDARIFIIVRSEQDQRKGTEKETRCPILLQQAHNRQVV